MREVDILTYLPQVLKEVEELVAIAKVENPVVETLWEKIETTINNRFITTADKDGIQRYEKIMKIPSDNSEDLEIRRLQVLTRNQEKAPFSYAVIERMLNMVLGESEYTLTRNAREGWVQVVIELTSKRHAKITADLLERIVPLTMNYINDLHYNEHFKLDGLTHEDLAALTHYEIREEVLPNA